MNGAPCGVPFFSYTVFHGKSGCQKCWMLKVSGGEFHFFVRGAFIFWIHPIICPDRTTVTKDHTILPSGI